jgi:porin
MILALGALLLPGAGTACEATATGCQGLTFTAAYTGEPIRNLDGGVKTGGTYLDNLDLQLAADRSSIFGIPGLSGLLYVLYNNDAQFSDEYVGDIQVVSNIDAPQAWRFYEVWLDWMAGDEDADSFSARFGLYDLNSEFDTIETAQLFTNSSHGIGPDYSQSGLNGPSIFPVTSLALRLRGTTGSGYYWEGAVLDGVPGDPDDPASDEINLSADDGALIALEAGFTHDQWRKLALGAWRYTAAFDELVGTTPSGDPVRSRGNQGIYAIADRTLAEGDVGTIAAFIRFGMAAERYNEVGRFLSAGTTWEGFWQHRADDQIGLAVAMAFTGSDYREAERDAGTNANHHETAIELTYRTSITDWFALQPDVQYVINPGANPDLSNALVMSLRFEVQFSWSR